MNSDVTYSDFDLVAFLLAAVNLGWNGLRKESITFQVTNNRSVTLTGKKRIVLSLLILSIGGLLLFVFVGVILLIWTYF